MSHATRQSALCWDQCWDRNGQVRAGSKSKQFSIDSLIQIEHFWSPTSPEPIRSETTRFGRAPNRSSFLLTPLFKSSTFGPRQAQGRFGPVALDIANPVEQGLYCRVAWRPTLLTAQCVRCVCVCVSYGVLEAHQTYNTVDVRAVLQAHPT